jgi:hypothetical protein
VISFQLVIQVGEHDCVYLRSFSNDPSSICSKRLGTIEELSDFCMSQSWHPMEHIVEEDFWKNSIMDIYILTSDPHHLFFRTYYFCSTTSVRQSITVHYLEHSCPVQQSTGVSLPRARLSSIAVNRSVITSSTVVEYSSQPECHYLEHGCRVYM